jgi:MFS family permease
MSTSITENTPLIVNEQGATKAVATKEQKQQVRYLYLVYFLSTISISIVSTLSMIFIEEVQIEDKTISITTKNLPNLTFASLVLSSIPWGILADRIGRKKVLNVLLLGSTFSTALFGHCRTINSATYVSFLIGAFSCSYIVVRTMIAESSIKSHRAYYFTRLMIITGVAINIGSIISAPFIFPLIGSPSLFNIAIPKTELPYKIPCLIASIISTIAVIISHFCLNETLGSMANEYNDSNGTEAQQSDTLVKPELTTVLGLAISKDINFILNGFCLATIIFSGFATVVLYWAKSEVDMGGLGLKSEYALMIIGATGFISLPTILLYPSLHRKYGSFKLYKTFFLPTAVIFIISSMLRFIAKIGDISMVITLFAVIITTLTIFRIFQQISLDLLLIDSSKSTNNLATLFGISSVIVQILNCNSIYVFILNISVYETLPSPLKFNLVWILLALVSFIGYKYSSKRNLD